MQKYLEEILKAATLAPSVDNCQPWLFSVKDDSIEIYLDSERAEFFGDVNHIATYVTFGTVIENIIISAKNHGFSTDIRIFPSEDKNFIAHVRLIEGYKGKSPLSAFLHFRCTNRHIFQKKLITADILESLSNGAKDIRGAHVFLTDDRKTIKKIALLVKESDRIIFEHPLLHQGLFKWIRWTKDEIHKTKDGLPVSTLELNRLQQIAFKLISSWRTIKFLNKFGMSRVISNHSYKLVNSAAVIGLITTDGNTPQDYINGGRAFERIWLIATSKGLAFQPLGGIVFLSTKLLLSGGEGFSLKHQKSLREIYTSLCNIYPIKENNALIILFRIGYAPQPSGRTPRRTLESVIRQF
jgi:hypothetical protein